MSGEGTGKRPTSPRSLIERAADEFDLFKAPAGQAAPPLPTEPAPVAPAPVVAPVADVAASLASAGTEQDKPIVQPPVVPVPAPEAIAPFKSAEASWAGVRHPIDRKRLHERGLIDPDADVTNTSEEFRIVKRRVLAAAFGAAGQAADERGRFVLVSSAHPGDGKSWCAINLAMSLAAEQKLEVLLVDADFAKPTVCHRLGLPAGPGLMDALVDADVPVESYIIHTDVPSLSLLPAGRQVRNDTEFVASDRTREILDRLGDGNSRRIVILDSPPALAASLASELARHVGQTIVVVRADRTSEAALRDAIALLSSCQNIKLLLNGVKFSSSGRQFGSYYGKSA